MKNVTLLTLVFSVLIPLQVFSQENWELKKVRDLPEPLGGVFFLNEKTGYAVGGRLIFKSKDGGTTWSQVYQDTSEITKLTAIQFMDSLHGIAGGESDDHGYRPPLVVRTSDGGKTWSSFRLLEGVEFFGLAFVDPATGFLLTASNSLQLPGVILGSTDSGATWKPLFQSAQIPSSIDCPSSDTCYVGSRDARVFRTTNKGKDWTTLQTNVSGARDLISCFSSRICQADGAETSDGGEHWTDESGQRIDSTGPLRDMDFPSVDTGYALGYTGGIFRTVDKGVHWSNVADSRFNSILNDLHCLSSRVCQAAGYFGTIKTVDAGEHWSFIFIGYSRGFTHLHFTGPKKGFLLGQDGMGQSLMIGTEDGGDSWNAVFTAMKLHSLGFHRAAGYLYGTGTQADRNNGPLLGRTSDGGLHWSSDFPHGPYGMTAMNCPADSLCYGVYDDSVYKSTDGGSRWTAQYTGTPNRLTSVACTDESHCLAVGDLGTILRTTDGGASWSTQNSGTPFPIYSVACPLARVCYVAGGNGTVLKSKDAGETWSPSFSTTTFPLNSIFFLDSAVGYAAGNGGTVIKTENGGSSWNIQKRMTQEALEAIDCPQAGTCYATGYAGAFLRMTSNAGVSRFADSQDKPLVQAKGRIFYRVSEAGPVRLSLFSLSGKKLTDLFSGFLPPGTYDSPLPPSLSVAPQILSLEQGGLRRSLLIARP